MHLKRFDGQSNEMGYGRDSDGNYLSIGCLIAN